MIGLLRDGYTKLNDYEICIAIAEGRIRGLWMDDQDHNNAKLATKKTATDILNRIDERRKCAYNFWRMFN